MEANLTVSAANSVKNSQIQSELAATLAAKSLKVRKEQGEAAVDLIRQVEQLTNQLVADRIDVQL